MGDWHLAVDIGASSGKALAGKVEDGRIVLKEIYRFANGLHEEHGHLCWDIDQLAEDVIRSLAECRKQGIIPASMGIDTWGVDFVLLDHEGRRTTDAVAYRDSRADKIQKEWDAAEILSFAELYSHTGIQYQSFNTIYQLAALQKEHPEQIKQAESFLMIPEYLNYVLTGVRMNEYTNATTTALINASSKTWDRELMRKAGIPEHLFGTVYTPGTPVGRLKEDIQAKAGFDCEVILPATHDTGSAFAAVPATDHSVFLSSGTWSLLGTENTQAIATEESRLANFTNEGGVEYRYRYLKNIMGLWMIQSVRREEIALLKREVTFPELIEQARRCQAYQGVVNADDKRFLAPQSMKEEISLACIENGYGKPSCTGEILQCIYRSLSQDYASSIHQLGTLTGKQFTTVNIVGGGCQDMYLNQMTANAAKMTVLAGPVEGTALGNLAVQFLKAGEYRSIKEARAAIRESFDIKEVRPQ